MDKKYRVVLSSGHGLHVRGASGIIDEVTEARTVVEAVGEFLCQLGIRTVVFHENVARNARDNVNNIVRFHNSMERDLDISVHFNSVGGGIRDSGIGVETCYREGNNETREIAGSVSKAISGSSGLILRRVDGTFPRADLGFLNRTNRNAILIEVCFVNSRTDVKLYHEHFEDICRSIANCFTKRVNAFPAVKWLDQLLSNADAPGVLDNRIDNGISDLGTALDVLVDAGIINTPEYWMSVAGGSEAVPKLDELLLDIANRCRNPLERIIWAEARGEDRVGQILVGNVIMNRHRSSNFPTGLYNVIHQNGLNSHGEKVYQFSPVGDGSYGRAVRCESVSNAVNLVLRGEDYSRGALFFRTIRGAEGSWHQMNLTHLFDHGGHRFYK